MSRRRHYIIPLISLIIISCGGQKSDQQAEHLSDSSSAADKEVEFISEKNTDMAPIKNIERPKRSKIISSKFPVDELFGIWTYDLNGPHADFLLSEKSFSIVDYDGDGDMPYILNHDTLTIYYNDNISKGLIKKVTKDTLIISWDNRDDSYCFKWKQ